MASKHFLCFFSTGFDFNSLLRVYGTLKESFVESTRHLQKAPIKCTLEGEARYVNVHWSVHWGCNYQELLVLLKNPFSVHLIGAYCKWRGFLQKIPLKDQLTVTRKFHQHATLVLEKFFNYIWISWGLPRFASGRIAAVIDIGYM